MGKLLVVDGSAMCRAPIVAFILRDRFARTHHLRHVEIDVRGVDAEPDRTMCDGAAGRIGFSAAAVAFYGAHRSMPLSVTDLVDADIVLTSERAQRSAVVRMLPGTQTRVFTWKEALILLEVLHARRTSGAPVPHGDLRELSQSLHTVRGTVPLIEPAVRTGVFHWGRALEADPLTVTSGHEGAVDHRRITKEAVQVANKLSADLADLVERPNEEACQGLALPSGRRRLRRSA